MNRVLFCVLTIVLLSGCSSLTEGTSKLRKQGIIDACYTVMEYNPDDKSERIANYLAKKQDADEISQDESYIIQQCLIRTQKSDKWSK